MSISLCAVLMDGLVTMSILTRSFISHFNYGNQTNIRPYSFFPYMIYLPLSMDRCLETLMIVVGIGAEIHNSGVRLFV